MLCSRLLTSKVRLDEALRQHLIIYQYPAWYNSTSLPFHRRGEWRGHNESIVFGNMQQHNLLSNAFVQGWKCHSNMQCWCKSHHKFSNIVKCGLRNTFLTAKLQNKLDNSEALEISGMADRQPFCITQPSDGERADNRSQCSPLTRLQLPSTSNN